MDAVPSTDVVLTSDVTAASESSKFWRPFHSHNSFTMMYSTIWTLILLSNSAAAFVLPDYKRSQNLHQRIGEFLFTTGVASGCEGSRCAQGARIPIKFARFPGFAATCIWHQNAQLEYAIATVKTQKNFQGRERSLLPRPTSSPGSGGSKIVLSGVRFLTQKLWWPFF